MSTSYDSAAREQQDLVRHSARDFIEQKATLARLLEIEASGVQARDIWQSLAEMEWTGLLVPPEYGGVGSTLADAGVIYEEMGRQLLPSPHHSSCVLAALILGQGGDAEQKRRYLPQIASGAQIFAPVIADDGQDPDLVQLRATQQDGAWFLNGVQPFVPDAGTVDRLLCVARTGNAGNEATIFVLDAHAKGVTMRRMAGWTGQPLYEVRLDGVQVTAADTVGSVGSAWNILRPAIRIATVLLCEYMAAATERVWEITTDYAHHRVQFSQPIARFQRVQDHLVNMRNDADAGLLSSREALQLVEDGDPRADLFVSTAKALASQGFYQACETAHHVHAGIGSVKDYGLYLYTKTAHSCYQYLGNPDTHEQRVGELLAAEPA